MDKIEVIVYIHYYYVVQDFLQAESSCGNADSTSFGVYAWTEPTSSSFGFKARECVGKTYYYGNTYNVVIFVIKFDRWKTKPITFF